MDIVTLHIVEGGAVATLDAYVAAVPIVDPVYQGKETPELAFEELQKNFPGLS